MIQKKHPCWSYFKKPCPMVFHPGWHQDWGEKTCSSHSPISSTVTSPWKVLSGMLKPLVLSFNILSRLTVCASVHLAWAFSRNNIVFCLFLLLWSWDDTDWNVGWLKRREGVKRGTGRKTGQERLISQDFSRKINGANYQGPSCASANPMIQCTGSQTIIEPAVDFIHLH